MIPYQVVDDKDVLKRMCAAVQAHNEKQSQLCHTVRHGVLLTLDRLTFQFVKLLRKLTQLPSLADSDELPGVYTNRYQLAALVKCGTRTVYDHLTKLEAAGFIHKQFRGRQHDFIVWINPWIVLGDSFPTPKTVDLKTGQNPGFKEHIRQISPPKNILERSTNTTNSGVDSVEKLNTVIGSILPPPNPRVCDKSDKVFILERAVDPSLPAPENILEKGRGGARPGGSHPPVPADDKGGDGPKSAQGDGGIRGVRPPKRAVSHSQPPVPPGERSPRDFATKKLQKQLVTGFWEEARQRFWPKQYFSEEHTRKVLNLIWNDVFGFHSPEFSTDGESFAAYHRRMDQLGKAHRWILKQQWTSVLPPQTYFSRAYFAQQQQDKQKGSFHHTEAWLVADERTARRIQGQALVERAVRSVIAVKAPRNHPDPAPTAISLYGYWLNHIRKYGDAQLIDAYNAGVAMVTNPVEFSPTPAATA